MQAPISHQVTAAERTPFVLLVFSILLGTPSGLFAAITSFDVVEVSDVVVPGFRSFDIQVTGTGELIELQMLSDVHYGSIFQHPQAIDTVLPPSESAIASYPNLVFDTFVAAGSNTLSDPSTPHVKSGALGIGGASSVTFDEQLLDIFWSPPAHAPIHDPSEFLIARLTISEDACGEINLRATALEDGGETHLDFAFMLEPIPIDGDYNGSGCVEVGDLNLALDHWGELTWPLPPAWVGPAPTPPLFDLGEINRVLDNWGRCQCKDHSNVTLSSVPEPITVNCGLVGCLAIVVLARRNSK